MSNFRTRILGLAFVASAFAGLSYGQVVTCTTGPQTNPTLRSEGQTELLAQLVVTCTNTAGSPATSGTVYIQTSLPITSKTFGFPAVNEATLVVTGAGVGGTVQGIVSGNQVSFTLPVGAIPAGAAAAIFTVSNIRVNAASGGAPQVTESGILSYSVVGPPVSSSNTAIPASAQGAGFILKTLGPISLTPGLTAIGYTTCVANGTAFVPPAVSFQVEINELVSGAFLTQNVAAQPNEQGQVVTPPSIGTANSGDIINVTIANVPSAATIYVPQTIANGGTTLTIANSTAVTSGPLVTAVPAIAPQVAFTPSANTVVVPYTVTTATVAGPLQFLVPVRMAFAANAVTAQGAVTASVAYGPAAPALAGPATSIPTFLAGTPVTANAGGIAICQTTLLYPFVTNQLGFDTGIVISNTSTDALGIAGKSLAAAQAGTCVLSFFGAGAPTPATGVADPGGSTATGTTHAFLLSAVAPGFQGYMIATCPFQFAHGFGFLAYNLTQNNGAVEGYLAPVLTRGSSAPEGATF